LEKLNGGEERRVSMRTHRSVPTLSGSLAPATVHGRRTTAVFERPLNGSMPFRPTPPLLTLMP